MDDPSGVFLLDRMILSLVGKVRIVGESSLIACAKNADHLTNRGSFDSQERLKQRSRNGPE
jgi:hypothetical protein